MTPALSEASGGRGAEEAAPPLARLRALVSLRLGLELADERARDLERLLRERARALGLDARGYLERLDSPLDAAAELRLLSQGLAVNETYFFRGADHFEVLLERVLSPRACALARGETFARPLRILSAGCASGEEPYTIAILVLSRAPELEADGIEITGLDANRGALERAARGVFGKWSLRSVGNEMRAAFFRPEGDRFALIEPARRLVRFVERNLVDAGDDDVLREGAYDAILCRNVLIYFTPGAIQASVARLSRALVPGGLLFLGHAEGVRAPPAGLEGRSGGDTFWYERTGALGTMREAPAREATQAQERPSRSGCTPAEGAGDALDPEWLRLVRRSSERLRALAAGVRREGTREGPAPDPSPPAPTAPPPVTSPVAPFAHPLGREGAADCFLEGLKRESDGDRDGAAARYEAALERDPAFALPHLRLGLIARRGGDRATARRALQRALLLVADDDEARLTDLSGGFGREVLAALCRSELLACGGAP